MQRVRDLFDRNVVSQSQLDDAETRFEIAQAFVSEIEAKLDVARLPARERLIAAAEAAVDVARASKDEAAWQLEKRGVVSPSSGMVFEIFRRRGEISGPHEPVLSFLPEGAVLLRLYVPELYVAGISPGVVLEVGCDGCPEDATATVTYVSDEPEFTPPVIYSLENRQKLVYLIEAQPDPEVVALKPGQIVNVRLGRTP